MFDNKQIEGSETWETLFFHIELHTHTVDSVWASTHTDCKLAKQSCFKRSAKQEIIYSTSLTF